MGRDWQKGWRMQLAKAVTPVKTIAQPLFKGWLLNNQNSKLILILLGTKLT